MWGMRELHTGAQRHLHEVRHLRVDIWLLITELRRAQPPKGASFLNRPQARNRAEKKPDNRNFSGSLGARFFVML